MHAGDRGRTPDLEVVRGDVGWECRSADHVAGIFATFDTALRFASTLAAQRGGANVVVRLPEGTELADVLFG